MTTGRRTRVRVLWVLIAGGLAAYSWEAASIRPFTVSMDVAVAAPEVGMVILAFAVGYHRRSGVAEARPTGRAVAQWSVFAVALAAWEAAAYFSTPRRDHPTLSSMAGTALATHPGRAALFAAWLLLGWAILVRTQIPTSPGSPP